MSSSPPAARPKVLVVDDDRDARALAAVQLSDRFEVFQADLDATTQLPRRPAFEARLGHEITRSERSGSPLSVMLVDLDGFGDINARYGTHTGDSLLKEVAATLRQTLRASDGVYRYGGDEFAALLCDSDIATAFVAAERCRGGISKITWDGHPAHVSIGTAELSSGRGPEEIVTQAEIALFRAQESGGNRCWRADDPRRHGLSPAALSQRLTDREWDLLAHLANRRSESEIARHMGIRAGTVRSHKARIRRKLGVHPDVKLTDFALSNFRDLVDRLGRLDSADEAAG